MMEERGRRESAQRFSICLWDTGDPEQSPGEERRRAMMVQIEDACC